MKILSIIDSDRAYGKERANLQVDYIMREHGDKVVVLYNKAANRSVRDEIASYDNYEIPFPRNLGGRKCWWKYLWAFIMTQIKTINVLKKEKPDFILVPTEIAFTYLYLPLLISRAKVVFRCGDSPLVYRKKGLIARIYGVIWRYLILKHIDIIVSNARYIQKQITYSGRIQNDRDVLIYNYPPVRAVQNDSAVYNNHPHALKIGFMGRIVADKGVRELIQAIRQINQGEEKIMVYICGDVSIDKTYYTEIKGISDKSVEFVGTINDLDKFYKHVDLVCIPSIYPEPMANVVTEAKYHRKSVIIFNQGGMPEIVEHKRTGYICKDVSVDGLKDGFMFYLDNPILVREHGENAYRSIEELGLTKEIFRDKWLKIFS